MSVYPFIEAEKAEPDGNVAMACRLLEVSRSAYYEWSVHTPSRRQLSDAELGEKIEQAYVASRRTYGAPRIAKALRRDGICVAKKRVARLMAERGLVGRCKRRYKKTTVADPAAEAAADLVKRAFGPGTVELDRVYVGDITYIWTWEGWLYLASVIDLASRRVVGWSMADHMEASLVGDALQMAIDARRPAPGFIFHSDRGSQGGFNRSSQHLTIAEVFDGSSSDGSRSRSAAGDAITGASTTPARDRATVLDGDRQGTHADRGSRRRRSFAASRPTLVSQRRRHGAIRFRSAVRPLPLVS